MKFTKLVQVTLDLISVYNIYKFHVNHFKNKWDLGHRKSRKWKVFRRLPEVDESVSGRPNIFWYYERHSLNWYRFYCKIKYLKFPVTTGSDGRHAHTSNICLILEIYHLWKFQVSIYNRFGEHSRTWSLLKNRKTAIFTDRKWIFWRK